MAKDVSLQINKIRATHAKVKKACVGLGLCVACSAILGAYCYVDKYGQVNTNDKIDPEIRELLKQNGNNPIDIGYTVLDAPDGVSNEQIKAVQEELLKDKKHAIDKVKKYEAKGYTFTVTLTLTPETQTPKFRVLEIDSQIEY